MSKTLTLTVSDEVYERLQLLEEADGKMLSAGKAGANVPLVMGYLCRAIAAMSSEVLEDYKTDDETEVMLDFAGLVRSMYHDYPKPNLN